MSVYNNAPHLALAIESILAQTVADFEFLIVDDGSTDGSAEIIDAHAARDGRIRASHGPNRGLVASLNHMVDEARSPLIARMDGDDVALPRRFERQLAFLDTNPDHGVVGTWTSDIDGAGRPYPLKGDDQPSSHEAFLRVLETGPLLCHPSVIMRRDLVRAVGGYHRAFAHCEDYDLWLRLAERTRIASIPERLLLYRHTSGQVSSRHAVAQQVGARMSWEAHRRRTAGLSDPTEGLDALPPLDAVDAMFERPGLAASIRATVAMGILYSPAALRGEGYDMVMAHVRGGGDRSGLWRTAARLLKLGEPARAIRLAAALAR